MHLTLLRRHCCFSFKNNSRIETMVIVQENREILTHNSRRFLVVCNFVPETFTFKASVAMPIHLLNRKKAHSDNPHSAVIEPVMKPKSHSVSEVPINDRNDIFGYEQYRQQHNVGDSRMFARQEHRVVDLIKDSLGR